MAASQSFIAADQLARRGLAFRDGKLYRFEPRMVEVYRAWPDLRAWLRPLPVGAWRHTLAPGFQLGDLDARVGWLQVAERMPAQADAPTPPARRQAQAARDFLATFPPEVLDLARPYPSRQWHVLAALSRVPEAADLGRHHPALLWLLASHRTFHACTQPMRRARHLVRLRLPRLLAELGFPDRRAVVHVLDRMPPSALTDVADLLRLRDRLHDAKFLKEVGHLPRLPATALWLLTQPELHAVVTCALVREWLAELGDQDFDPVWAVRSVVTWSREFGLPLPPLRDLKTLRARQAEIAERRAAYESRARLHAVPWPAPPLQVPGLQPLTSYAALEAEGARMHHCIAVPEQGYARQVALGHGYAWHGCGPCRTVYAERTQGVWRPVAARGLCNAKLAEDEMQRVVAAFAAAQGVEANKLALPAGAEDDVPF